MSREEYFMCLDGYLRKLTDEERMEAIQYYKDYFDEAGPENEQSVIENLGSPRELAQSILDGEKTGEFTENGYRKTEEAKAGISAADFVKKDSTKLVVGIIVIIIAFPVIISLISSLLGIIVGLAGAAVALIIGGTALFFSSFPMLFQSVGIGMLFMGAAFVMVSLAILLILAEDFIFRVIIPLCIKMADSFMGEFFGNKKN